MTLLFVPKEQGFEAKRFKALSIPCRTENYLTINARSIGFDNL
jgi:hypothetical protein